MGTKNNLAFSTENLLFRQLKVDDKFDVYRLFSDPQVTKLDESEPMKSLLEAEKLIQYAECSIYDPSKIYWAVERKGLGRVIGTCGFKNWDRIAKHAEIGGNIASEFWGRGYAKEGLTAILNYAFHQMDLNKICALTSCRNNTAIGILNKYGFHLDGTLREHQFLYGEYIDVLAYSLLKSEYVNRVGE